MKKWPQITHIRHEARKILSKYGVDVYLEEEDPEIALHVYHVWIAKGSKIIGNGWRIRSDKEGFYTSNMTSKTRNLAGEQTQDPDWDKIISGGIACYLSECENTKDLIKHVPSKIWKNFPALPKFIAKYDKKILEAPEGTYIEGELEEEIRGTDFKIKKRMKKNNEKSL